MISRKHLKYLFICTLLLFSLSIISGCTKNNEIDKKSTSIIINGIYNLNIIGEKPTSVGYKMPSQNNIIAYLGVWNDGSITAKLDYGNDRPSSFGISENTSLIDERLNTKISATIDKVDINKKVIVYVQNGNYVDSQDKVIAYSKIVDMKHRVNNISRIQFGTKNIKSTDIIAAVVAVVKSKNGYKLVSNTVDFEVAGKLPKKMQAAAIDEPTSKLSTIDINKMFLAYMTFTNLKQVNKPGSTYSVKLVTYSPVNGGKPVNMDKQSLTK